jgi:hypothetical protein
MNIAPIGSIRASTSPAMVEVEADAPEAGHDNAAVDSDHAQSVTPRNGQGAPIGTPAVLSEAGDAMDITALGPQESSLVFLGASQSGARGAARADAWIEAYTAPDPRTAAASARPAPASSGAAASGAASASQAAAHEPEGLKPTKNPVRSGADAHAFAPSDRVADGSNVLLQMVRTSPRHDIDNPADRPSYQQDPEFNAAFSNWFSPWFETRRPRLRDVTRPDEHGRGASQDANDLDDEDEWEEEARATGWTEPEVEADPEFELLDSDWSAPDPALYRRIVTQLMAEKFQLHVVPHVLNELRRLRRVVLVTPVQRARVGLVDAHVDVLCPTRHGGSVLRMAGTIEWTVDPAVAGWMLLHVFKAQTSGGAMRFHPVSSTPHTTRLLVAAMGQPFAESGQAHARVRLSDGTRLRRALQSQWSLRMALGPNPIDLSSSDADAHAAPKGPYAS